MIGSFQIERPKGSALRRGPSVKPLSFPRGNLIGASPPGVGVGLINARFKRSITYKKPCARKGALAHPHGILHEKTCTDLHSESPNTDHISELLQCNNLQAGTLT
jgi:hypothetical protein